MKYKREILVKGIPAGADFRFSYPYLDCTCLDDIRQNQRRGMAGLLDEGDEAIAGTEVIDCTPKRIPC